MFQFGQDITTSAAATACTADKHYNDDNENDYTKYTISLDERKISSSKKNNSLVISIDAGKLGME